MKSSGNTEESVCISYWQVWDCKATKDRCCYTMLSNAYKLRLSDDILRVKSLENLELNERNFMKIAISLDDLVILSFPEFREVHPSDLWTSEARGKFWFLKQIITKMELLLERIRNFVKEELGKPHFSWLVRVTHLFKLFLFPQPANPPTEWFSPDWLRRWGLCPPAPLWTRYCTVDE